MEFRWMNESAMVKNGAKIEITATPHSDFFISRSTENGALVSVNSAPFYYTELHGDFVMRAKVSLDFQDTYDSACIMVMNDLSCWAKACLELTDFGTHAVVSVVTKGESDDANGCNIDGNSVWLQVCRTGNTFAFHYSANGTDFYMMRYFSLPAGDKIKAGLLAQAPAGSGGIRIFEDVSVELKTVKNIRAGK